MLKGQKGGEVAELRQWGLVSTGGVWPILGANGVIGRQGRDEIGHAVSK